MSGKNIFISTFALAIMIMSSGLVAGSPFVPLPSKAPVPADNPQTATKIILGKMLFFDPRLSNSKWISCATCHNPSLGFTDRIPRAFGHKMSEGPRNTPTILNAAFLDVQFWDGRAKTLEEQALGPIQAGVEMNDTLENVVKKLQGVPEYRKLFAQVFGATNPITAQNVGKAIAAFERTIITPDSPYDRYLKGDKKALSKDAVAGMKLFSGKGCVACHNGPALSDSRFHKIQIPGSTDQGRFNVTKNEQDRHAFRTPTLRNVALTHPYFNNGSVESLREAVQVMGKTALNTTVNDEDARLIEAFLVSTTGKMPKIDYPLLP